MCLQTAVVMTSSWPTSSWVVRISESFSHSWVADEWRRAWQLTGLAIRARNTVPGPPKPQSARTGSQISTWCSFRGCFSGSFRYFSKHGRSSGW